MPVRRWRSLSSQRIRSRSLASRFDSGSSSRRIARLDHQAPGQRHALLLAAAQLARIARLEPGEVDQLQHARHARPRLRPRRPAGPPGRRRRCRTRSCAARSRSSGTPCPSRAAPAGRRRPARRGVAVHSDGPRVGRDEAGDRGGAASSCRSRSGRAASGTRGPDSRLSSRTATAAPNRFVTRSMADAGHQDRPPTLRHASVARRRAPRRGPAAGEPMAAPMITIVTMASAATGPRYPVS